MSLRTKVVGLLLAFFLGLTGLQYAVQELVIYPRLARVEREEALKAVERALRALEGELELLVPSVTGWTGWNQPFEP